MKALAVIVLATASLPALAAPSTLQPLRRLAAHGAQVSALVIRLHDGKTLGSFNDRLPLTPASVSKLYVAAAALKHWGPDYRFTTRLLGTGPVKDGVLHGDLVFAGAGDPALANEQLFTLTRRLAERGVRRVTGNLVVDAGYFGHVACVTEDRCSARHGSHNAYDALLSSAAVNFATAELAVTPAANAGSRARVQIVPVAISGITVINNVRTTHANSRWSVTIRRHTRHGHDVFIATGQVPAGAQTRRYWRALGHPNRATAGLLKTLLKEAGVRVDGGIRVERSGGPRGESLAQIQGQPLWMQLRRMLTWSNNFMADTLTLDLLRTDHVPPLKLEAGGKLLTGVGRSLETESGLWDKKHAPRLVLESGSGLTTDSRASARDLVALLAALYHRPGLFPSFLGALTVPGYTPVAMLKDPGDGAWMQAIAAKTGSLNQPHSVFALAGYARLKDGGWGAFAVLVNGSKRDDVPLDNAISATREALSPYLESPGTPENR